MNTVFKEYIHLWPESRRAQLKPVLNEVFILKGPVPEFLPQELNLKKTIVILKDGRVDDCARLLSQGFNHVLQEQREDFPQQLITACLMILRPNHFAGNPPAFFLNEFATTPGDIDQGTTIELTSNSQKRLILDTVAKLLDRDAKTRKFQEVATMIADEMVMNAIFNAPVDHSGKRIFQNIKRSDVVQYPADTSPARFTARFKGDKLLLACEDPFGSIRRQSILELIGVYYKEDTISLKDGAGAGVGIRFIIDNSANFYLYSEVGTKTIFASVLLLSSLSINQSTAKHFHISIR